MGGAGSQDSGRPTTRGQEDGGRSISHPRGIPGKASVQPPHQEGDLPSGLTPSVPPPPPAPERTQPQRGGQPRSALRDPMQLVANFHSSGWRKDLEHILRVYYKFSIASFREAEWVRFKERFFDHFLQHKEEALALKEAHPMDFMAYVQDLFYQATGLHLDGLVSFNGWIKRGSYYHGIVARQGCLHECLHLIGAPLPRWPQVAPSESRQESQMKSMPRSLAPVSLVRELWRLLLLSLLWQRLLWWRFLWRKFLLRRSPPWRLRLARPRVQKLQLPPPSHLLPWRQAEWAMAQHGQSKWRPAKRSRPAKCARSQSRRREPKPQLPFPLQDSEGRLASILQLHEHAVVQPAAPHNVAGRAIMHLHPNLLLQKATRLGNQVACMIAEYHLTASARQSSLHPIIPQEAAPLLPPLKNYVPGVAFEGTRDVRVVDHAMAL